MQDSQRISELRRLLASDSISDPAIRQQAEAAVARADRRRSGNELADESGFYRADDNQLHLTMRANAPDAEDRNRWTSTGMGIMRTLGRGATDMLRGIVELPDDVMGYGRGQADRMERLATAADQIAGRDDLTDRQRAFLERQAENVNRHARGAREAETGIFRRLGNNIPQIDVGNNWERGGAMAVQFAAPAVGTRSGLNSLARGGRDLVRRAGVTGDDALSRIARGVAGEAAVAPAVLATEMAVTDPDQAETLGDVLGGPTRIQDTDSRLTRRLRVGAEGAAMNAAASPIIDAGVGAARGAMSLLSGRPAIENTIRRTLGDGLSQEQLETAVTHLRALEEANSTLARTGDIQNVPQRLRPFVTPPGGQPPVTMDAYLTTMMRSDARGVANAVQQAASESEALSGRLAHQADMRTDNIAGAIADMRPDEGLVDGRLAAAQDQAKGMADTATDVIEAGQGAQRALRETVEQQRQAGGRVRDILFDNIDPRNSIAIPRGPFNRAYNAMMEEGREALGASPIGQRALQRINRHRSRRGLTYGDMNRLRRDLNQLIRTASQQGEGEVVGLLNNFKGIFGEYTEHLAGQRHPAANVARAAMDFFTEDYAPRFRRQAGQRYTQTTRGGRADVTSDEQVANLFLNNRATGLEDAETLARILRGYEIDESTVRNILQNNGVNTDEVLGSLNLTSPGQSGRGAVQVNQIMQGRYAEFLRGNAPTPKAAEEFIRNNRRIIQQFPEVADAIRSYGDNFQTATVRNFVDGGGEMGRSPMETIQNVMSRNAEARMSSLIDDARRSANPDQAMADLRAVTAEWFHSAVVKNGGDSTARSMRRMLADPSRRRALENIFGQDEIGVLETYVRQFEAVDSARHARNSSGSIRTRDPADIFREIMVDFAGAQDSYYGRSKSSSIGRLIGRVRRAVPGNDFDALQNRMLDEMASDPTVLRQYLEPYTAVKQMERHYRDVLLARGGSRALLGFRENEETE